MTAWRRAIELSIGGEDLAKLASITRSRREPASRVERARMLLAYREDPSFFAVGRALGVHHQTVQRCVERALAYGSNGGARRSGAAGQGTTFCGKSSLASIISSTLTGARPQRFRIDRPASLAAFFRIKSR